MAYLAVDLGGSHVTCGVVADGVLLAYDALPLSDSLKPAPVLPALSDTLSRLRKTNETVTSTGLESASAAWCANRKTEPFPQTASLWTLPIAD